METVQFAYIIIQILLVLGLIIYLDWRNRQVCACKAPSPVTELPEPAARR